MPRLKRLPRKVVLLLAVVLVALVGVTYYLQFTSPPSTGPWMATRPYPLQVNGTAGVLGLSCVASSGTAYCIGGEDAASHPSDSVYHAPLTSSGIGNWTASQSPYPEPIMFTSCVGYSGYVYCVGGTHTGTGNDTSSSYFAPASNGGLGKWTGTSPYPVTTDSQSCVAASGQVYCVGGQNETSGSSSSQTDSNSVWYASLSPSGIGTWSRTTAYPGGVFFPECSTQGGYVYCVGGQSKSGTVVSSAYYASVSANGLGQWTPTSPYPVGTTAQSCAASSTVLYCVGGLVTGGSATGNLYYAGLSPAGIGSWQQGGGYPTGLATECISSSEYLYCIGGYDPGSPPTAESYFVPVSSSSRSGSST